jgi:hypothetical protein
MPITHTNRKDVAYQLCRGSTKSGKVRYYFAREPRDAPVEELPDGYSIRESVNGVVSLARDTPTRLLPAEVAAVAAAVRRHPHADRYRVDVRRDRIDIYERTGADAAELAAALGLAGVELRGMIEHLRAEMERHARYAPVLRFTLMDEANRTCRVERWCYLGSIDDWITLMPTGPAEELARRLVPALGTDEFFELF